MQRTLLSSVETPISPMPEAPSRGSRSNRDPYRGVVFVLLLASLVGAAGALAGGITLPNALLLDTAITLTLATRILIGVASAQAAREASAKSDATPVPSPSEATETPVETDTSLEGTDSRMSSRLVGAP